MIMTTGTISGWQAVSYSDKLCLALRDKISGAKGKPVLFDLLRKSIEINRALHDLDD